MTVEVLSSAANDISGAVLGGKCPYRCSSLLKMTLEVQFPAANDLKGAVSGCK